MQEGKFKWERTKDSFWDVYLRTRLDSGTLLVGYNMGKKELVIAYNDPSVHEHVLIANGEVIDKARDIHGKNDKHLKQYSFFVESPKIIRDSLEMIIATIPDEEAVKVLRELSLEEWAKIEPTEFERETKEFLYTLTNSWIR